ncbi:Glycerophosphoryl diester phosphodiesterase [Nocardioides terrae]|uniref:Glycerophosphoryl diester phosphodiesterase n=1 Tax=Nocardioides terrae TaxID=574651 RepID=A0A1I1FJM3_9ACTN|nr:glycerophosphodiester phosphodiesterase family protein [Nocardioides terrae]SFB99617.1 Glycerophosphoryl diester phosphodiesterase [Nocardioides terrae]
MPRRPLAALFTLALVPLAGAGLVAGASPASAKIVHVRAPHVSGALPIGNEPVTISGNLGRSVVRTVRLQRLYGGGWHTVSRATAGARHGHYHFRVATPGPSSRWRVTAPPVNRDGKRYQRRLTGSMRLNTAVQTASVSAARSVRIATPLAVSLAFAPARPGRGAALEINDGSGWRSLAGLAQDGAGHAAFSYTPPASGVVQLRAVAAAYHGAAAVAGPPTTLYILPAKRMKVAAHRGYSGYYPENTLAAYTGALDQSAPSAPADWLETDFQKTAPTPVDQTCDDGTATVAGKSYWVALHDADLARTTNVESAFPRATNPTKYDAQGRPLVGLFTLCEIKKLDAGSWKSSKWAGTRVPTLEQTLDLLVGSSATDTQLLVEPKHATPTEAIELYDAIKAYDTAHAGPGYQELLPADPAVHTDRAVFNTFNDAVVAALNAQRPGAEVAMVADEPGEVAPRTDRTTMGIFLRDDLATQANINLVHAAHQQVFVWTVNDRDRWLELDARGVDNLVTDASKPAREQLTGTE